MAIDYTGITSIDTGAPDIKYTGDEGPRSPEENREVALTILGDEAGEVASQLWNGMSPPEKSEWRSIEGFIQSEDFKIILMQLKSNQQEGRGGKQMASAADPMLQEEYDKYVFEMQEQGLEPMSLEDFRQQAVAGMADGGKVPNIGPSGINSLNGWGSTDEKQNVAGANISAGMDRDAGHKGWTTGHGEDKTTQGKHGGWDTKEEHKAAKKAAKKPDPVETYIKGEAKKVPPFLLKKYLGKKGAESWFPQYMIGSTLYDAGKWGLNKIKGQRSDRWDTNVWDQDDVTGLGSFNLADMGITTPDTDYNTQLAKVFNTKEDLQSIGAAEDSWFDTLTPGGKALEHLRSAGTTMRKKGPTKGQDVQAQFNRMLGMPGLFGDVIEHKDYIQGALDKGYLKDESDWVNQKPLGKAVDLRADGGRAGYKNGYSVQGGVKNYLGNQEMVHAPKYWKSAPDHPKTELAYITDAEKDLLLKKDLHNSLSKGPNEGPEGLISLNGWGSKDEKQNVAGANISSDMDTDPGHKGWTTGVGENKTTQGKHGGWDTKEEHKKAKKEAQEQIKKDQEERAKIEDPVITKEDRKRVRDLKKLRQTQLLSKFDPRYLGSNYIGGKFNKNWWDMTEEEKDEYSRLGAMVDNPELQKLYNPYGKVDGIYVNPELQDIVANTPGDLSNIPPSERNRYRTDYDLMEEKIDDYYKGGSGAKQLQFTEGYNFPETGIVSVDALGNLLEGGAKRNRKFFTGEDYEGLFPWDKNRKSVLDAGKYKYKGMDLTPDVWNRLSLSEQEDVYKQYQKDRGAGYIDAYGNVRPDYYRGPDGTYISRGKDDYGGVPDAVPHGDIPEWQQQGFNSYADWLAAQGTGTTGTTGTSSIATGPITGQLGGISPQHQAILQNIYGGTLPTMFAADGGRAGYAGGGIADLRQGYFLGKIVKSVTKPFKKAVKSIGKFAKSPAGKLALLGLGAWKGPAILKGLNLGTGTWGSGLSALGSSFMDKPMPWILGASALGGLYTGLTQDDDEDEMYKKWLAEKQAADEWWIPRFDESNFRRIASAQGGRIGYADSGLAGTRRKAASANETGWITQKPEWKIVKQDLNNIFQEAGGLEGDGMNAVWKYVTDNDLNYEWMLQGDEIKVKEKENMDKPVNILDSLDGINTLTVGDGIKVIIPTKKAQGGRIGYAGGGNDDEEDHRKAALAELYKPGMQEGGLMDLGGMEKDYRNEGGFVPIGGQERADDVPARLSRNEFVFTADAVRAAGGGDIDRGAEVMENVMENLEKGGKVSEESQGLEGARNMFATAQRLEGVL